VQLCRTAAAETGLSGVVVTLASALSSSQAVLAASDEVSRARQELQFSTGEGPACDVHTSGRPVLVPALPAESGRWPAYVAAAVEAGVCAVFTFPLHQGALRIGALSGYSDHPRGLSTGELAVLLDRAGDATTHILDSTGRDPGAVGRDRAESVHLRNEVYQAQGIVTEQLGVGLAEALSRIRAHAFAAGLDLDALAIDIVAGRVRLTDDRSPTTDPEPRPRRPETEAP